MLAVHPLGGGQRLGMSKGREVEIQLALDESARIALRLAVPNENQAQRLTRADSWRRHRALYAHRDIHPSEPRGRPPKVPDFQTFGCAIREIDLRKQPVPNLAGYLALMPLNEVDVEDIRFGVVVKFHRASIPTDECLCPLPWARATLT